MNEDLFADFYAGDEGDGLSTRFLKRKGGKDLHFHSLRDGQTAFCGPVELPPRPSKGSKPPEPP